MGGAPAGESHSSASPGKDVVVDHEHLDQSRGRGGEDLLHPSGLRSRQVTLHRDVPDVPSERPEGDPIAAQSAHHNRAGDLEYRPELTVVPKVLVVFSLLPQQAQGALPPFDIVVPRDDDRGDLLPHPIQEDVRRLELAMPGALAQVARDDDRRRVEAGKEFLECLDLLEIGKTAEMEIGEMGNGDSAYAHSHPPTQKWLTI